MVAAIMGVMYMCILFFLQKGLKRSSPDFFYREAGVIKPDHAFLRGFAQLLFLCRIYGVYFLNDLSKNIWSYLITTVVHLEPKIYFLKYIVHILMLIFLYNKAILEYFED
jgi:hypothetical protein